MLFAYPAASSDLPVLPSGTFLLLLLLLFTEPMTAGLVR